MFSFISLFLPLAINIVTKYVESSETKKDDEILNLVQTSCKYLCRG